MVVIPGRAAPAPKRLPAGKRRQQLLDVALTLFATKGYNATTMDDIAETAGVTKPLLYQHFASKRALYMELVDSVASTMLAAIGDATGAAASPRQQVEGGFAAYFDLVVTHAHAFQLLFGSATPDDPEISDMLRHVEDVLAAAISPLIDAGLDDDHRQLLAYAVVGMAEGASRYVLANGPPGADLGTADAGAGAGDRGAADPGTADPGTADPGTADPGAADPGTADPGTAEDGAGGEDRAAAGNGVAAGDGSDGVARDDEEPVAHRLASRLADLAWAGLRSVHRD